MTLDAKAISMLISFISLGISIFTLWKNRKRLTVYFPEKLEVVPDNCLFLVTGQSEVSSYGEGFLITLEIVNPSPNDIAFFDLRVFNPSNNQNHYLLTRKTLLPKFKSSYIGLITFNNNFELTIPEANYGIFKSNSFTRIDIFIMVSHNISDQLNLSFKVAKNSLFKDKFAITNRKKYKKYSKDFDLSNYQEAILVSTELVKEKLEELQKNPHNFLHL